MDIIYNIGINITQLALKCTAVFNQKINLGVKGRANTFHTLEKTIKKADKTLWFHCASLGEYEQGLPVFKEVRKHFSKHKIILSFFSPSGFEVKKDSPIADTVIYLPIDTKKNAQRFFDILNPEMTIFVKYDIWPNFLNELKSRGLRAILISASFRKNQPYFKFYGKPLKKALFAFEHIFTQNEDSKTLLETINYTQITVNGDTRFDRVFNQLELDNTLDYIEIFKNNKICIVAGSTWPEDENLFIEYINNQSSNDVKFIIAPHNIKSNQIKNIQEKLNKEVILFSNKTEKDLQKAQVFILDTIGILSKVYSYADIAYVGGAMGKTGLHNTLEPAVFGSPIIIGNHFDKFPEAKALIKNGGMFSITNQSEFNTILDDLIKNQEKRVQLGNKNFNYVKNNKGAVVQILDYLRI